MFISKFKSVRYRYLIESVLFYHFVGLVFFFFYLIYVAIKSVNK